MVAGSLACRGLSFVGARGLLSAGGALLAFRCGRMIPPAAPPCVEVGKFVGVWVFASQGGGRQAVKERVLHGSDGVAAAVASSQMMNDIETWAERRCFCRCHSSFGMRLRRSVGVVYVWSCSPLTLD